jgi:hypothetical protein
MSALTDAVGAVLDKVETGRIVFSLGEAAFSSGARKPTFASEKLSAAWDVATKARANPALSDEDIAPLLAAIAKDPTYKDRHDKDEPYDGV